MRILTFILLLLASALQAQVPAMSGMPTVSTADKLSITAYQTTAAMTLYVDPTGSDSNACTASGTSACLTLGGALNKVPKNIRHAVTVNVATGTYTEVFRVQGFNIEGANGAASTAALNITGTQTAFTVATGTNTGTVSSYVAPTGGAHPLLNDATQTWTVNDLRGRYVTITSGSGNGEYHLITANTATQLSLAYQFTTAPTGASTYAIVTPGAVFTGNGATVEGIVGSGLLKLQDITIQPAVGIGLMVVAVQGPLNTTRSRFIGTTTGILAPTASTSTVRGASTWRANQTMAQGGTLNAVQLGSFTTFIATELFARCSGTCSGSGYTQPFFSHSVLTGTIAGDFTTALVDIAGGTQGGGLGIWLDCGALTNTAINLSAPTDLRSRGDTGWATKNGPYISNCAVGFSLNAPSTNYIDVLSTFNTVTTAISISGGAKVWIEPGNTYTGVTNQLTIDGTVYSDADLTTFTRITGPQGSYATRP